MPFAKAQVTGAYAIVHLRHSKPAIVRLRLKGPGKFEYNKPDVTNMVRWLHARFFAADLAGIRVLNWRLDCNGSWYDNFREGAARSMLTSIACSMAEERMFPVVGNHCRSCLTQACRIALEERKVA